MPTTSDLRDRQRKAGAIFAADSANSSDDPGLPVHFGDPRDEYFASATDAALFDWTDRGLIELTGKDRHAFLHNFCTNDIKNLAPGHGCEAFVTNVKGRVLGHIWIEASESALRLDCGPGSPERLRAHLERYIINEDVTVTDLSSEWGELLLMGPSSESFLTRAFADADARLSVPRRDVGLQSAYVIAAPREHLGAIWIKLMQAGVRPAGSAAWSALRIEAGLPIYGLDLTDENLAQEAARTEAAISFKKGCYLGQEPIARIDAMGHVNRELRSLRVSGDAMPSPGARVLSEAVASAVVGTVTSAAFSFGSNSPVALALLRSNVAKPDTALFVEIDSSLTPAIVFWAPGQSPM